MINLHDLLPSDVGAKVIYRGEGSAGPPEAGTIVDFDLKHIFIRLLGDSAVTKAHPSEVTRRVP